MSDAQREKHVSGKGYYGFDLVGLDPLETIDTCTCVATPSGLTLTGVVQIAGHKITQYISGGVAGTDYRLRFHIATNLGYEDDFDYVIKVIE
jgi:hypothetical protein